MPTLLMFHEVDDVDHWLASPKREKAMRVFLPLEEFRRHMRDEGDKLASLIEASASPGAT